MTQDELLDELRKLPTKGWRSRINNDQAIRLTHPDHDPLQEYCPIEAVCLEALDLDTYYLSAATHLDLSAKDRDVIVDAADFYPDGNHSALRSDLDTVVAVRQRMTDCLKLGKVEEVSAT